MTRTASPSRILIFSVMPRPEFTLLYAEWKKGRFEAVHGWRSWTVDGDRVPRRFRDRISLRIPDEIPVRARFALISKFNLFRIRSIVRPITDIAPNYVGIHEVSNVPLLNCGIWAPAEKIA